MQVGTLSHVLAHLCQGDRLVRGHSGLTYALSLPSSRARCSPGQPSQGTHRPVMGTQLGIQAICRDRSAEPRSLGDQWCGPGPVARPRTSGTAQDQWCGPGPVGANTRVSWCGTTAQDSWGQAQALGTVEGQLCLLLWHSTGGFGSSEDPSNPSLAAFPSSTCWRWTGWKGCW